MQGPKLEERRYSAIATEQRLSVVAQTTEALTAFVRRTEHGNTGAKGEVLPLLKRES